MAAKANDIELPTAYWGRIEAMLEFIASILDVRGNVPMIGDADDGYVVRLSQEAGFCPYQSLLATGAVQFERAAFQTKAGKLDDKTRWLLGTQAERKFQALAPQPEVLPVETCFADGGYYILGCDFETEDEIRAVVDVGPLGYLSIAAHGHADALALTLNVGGREFLIDPGTYAYHTQKKWRDYFRGTTAHNTVAVDGQDQSVIGGNFMWLQKAEASCLNWESTTETDHLIAVHDGYRRLADPVTHRREISLDKRARRLVVVDTLECRAPHRACWSWHFAEGCRVSLEDNQVIASNDGRTVRLQIRDQDAHFELRRGDTEPPCGWVSRAYDAKVETTTARAIVNVDGTTSITTEILCE
jgi:hypothetical protein